ncbi:DUF4760 domain-containing protein [Pseudomonas syringae pv. syringae]|uniref:DUF4760 domain-containing protein n=1 Tax=Pseudomonas syringae TaxID=317 RepID=UPI00073731D1|nr:DUF4760 domain-containing protein [Pseudomonas syringae]KTB79061.1 hypothetical protein AO069_08990 [Pseudomonas syringae pv. syringae PD2774]KWS18765.1 hypothetical protein AL064_22635 [Pseudomonas syringae pv. syringae]MCH5551046.1 DUF4760 domain-containing protein [Pseudomonas syringae pv. syringae]MEE1992022.1 DUF4760 domain-containing protein [Pseudomonas syringae pv. syringae]MEE1996859.1 DUF4760 domain-containing protein [Pseudomonas syringae pv. syringae]
MDMCLALAELLAKEALRNVLLFCGVLTAIVSMYMVLATAKKKQTADLLFGCRLDEQLQLGNARIAAMHDAQSPMKDLLLSCNEADRKEKEAVKYVLNHWERVAVGIVQGIYHEEMLRQSNHSNVVSLYKKAKPFIDAVRYKEQKDTFYRHFEKMALSWDERPRKNLSTWPYFKKSA